MPEGVYLYGGLTGWSLDPDYRMEYDASKQEFSLHTTLKQGWYDYQYVTPDGDEVTFEGSHAGTPNRYHVSRPCAGPGWERIRGAGLKLI